jgi:hypothetical protein
LIGGKKAVSSICLLSVPVCGHTPFVAAVIMTHVSEIANVMIKEQQVQPVRIQDCTCEWVAQFERQIRTASHSHHAESQRPSYVY